MRVAWGRAPARANGGVTIAIVSTSLRLHLHRLVAGATAVLLSIGIAAPARGQGKTDVVVLNNGDRLTGEIKGLSRGRLSFDADSTGVVSIKWDRVVALTTNGLVDVETDTGERLLGSLTPGTAGTVVVTRIGAPRTLPIGTVVGLAPIGRSFWKRLDGSIDVGGSYTQSSGIAQLSFNLLTTARRPTFEWRLTFDDYLTFQSDGAATEQLAGSVTYARYMSRRWAVFTLAQIERNPDLGFDLRGTLGGGVERTLVQSNRSELVAGAGLGGSRERAVGGETDSQLPAMLSVRGSLFIYNTPKTTLDGQFTAYPILNQAGRWRLRADASLKREIFKDFSVAFSFYESFDNRPPSTEASRNDVGATLSLAYVF